MSKSDKEIYEFHVDKDNYFKYGLNIEVEFENPTTGASERVLALLDTGSNRTAIEESLVHKIKLDSDSTCEIQNFQGNQIYQLYRGILKIPNTSYVRKGKFVGTAIEGVKAVIGRDVLRSFEISYCPKLEVGFLRYLQ